MVVKVKEPLPSEYKYLRPDLVLFTYLHLAATETLTGTMMQSGVTGVATKQSSCPTERCSC